jgi:radical SAM protein with 4Fe4S-binding SPASM domain
MQQGITMNMPFIPSFPPRVEIELSSACNFRCTYCPRQYLPPLGAMIDMDLFTRIVEECAEFPKTILTLHRRGESLLHPRLAEIMELVHGRFAEIQLATNGSLLTPEKYEALTRGLTFLSFSLDPPETFNATRFGACYADVEKNIQGFLAYSKGRVTTQASMVRVDSTTQEDCDHFISLWKDKVDRVRIYEEHSKDGVFGALKNARPERKPCTMPFYEVLVYADGTVGRCNHDWNGPPLGDLNKQSIREVWHSDVLTSLRRQQASLEFTDPVCKTCDSWYPVPGVQDTGKVV